MADVSKLSYILKIKLGFSDGDTCVINLNNPKNNLLLGKYGANSVGILKADSIESRKMSLDL